MKNMVDDFREYARPPAPQFQALDLNHLVAEVLALYENANLPVTVLQAEQLPLVQGDPTQLRQVLHNLLQNAQDALSGSGDPQIEVVTEHSAGKIWLRVRDNGCGFPDAIIKRVFEPYVTTKPKGTGLGLAIVKKIIDEHHGTISIENCKDRGAAVHISFPLAA
jgi:nitrogen fixation/metabolism regulation signal transduction histidine kinase